MPKASEVMKRASVLLLDEDNIRWPLSELADCINDAVKAMGGRLTPSSSRYSTAWRWIWRTTRRAPIG
jgi:hypothetical protein